MNITTLTSPPEKVLRRVRFSLPEAKLTFNTDKRTLHGTTKYINGTLINVTSTIHSANELGKLNSKNEVFKSSLKSNGNSGAAKESSQYKVSSNIRPATVMEKGRNSLPNAMSAGGVVSRRRQSKIITRSSDKSFNTLPIIERKSSSLEDFDDDSLDEDYREENSHDSKSKAPATLTRFKSSEDLRDSSNLKAKSSAFKLPEAENGSTTHFSQKKTSTSNILKVPSDYSDTLCKSHYFPTIFSFSFNFPRSAICAK